MTVSYTDVGRCVKNIWQIITVSQNKFCRNKFICLIFQEQSPWRNTGCNIFCTHWKYQFFFTFQFLPNTFNLNSEKMSTELFTEGKFTYHILTSAHKDIAHAVLARAFCSEPNCSALPEIRPEMETKVRIICPKFESSLQSTKHSFDLEAAFAFNMVTIRGCDLMC